ncbi:TauD/TfdA family dioxygenase [Azospirillum formosense]|uniref:TauD/TfdA family dioxygenase n=1 Tax=Azospirillum formosense TaxID=861533 RepID=A0ABX2L591_9PROT|nr:TauD/TfdA family dioxygenase [Azospirillum formosense]MBY3755648.1 TauD/TfdA family dioxygenase [Azospirillum formosense]NUB20923.1 TauD/TfdA family dioxygenase [Azospirillum formosense]
MSLSNAFDIKPINGNIGAEVRGVNLSGDLHPAVLKAIQDAVYEHKVVFVRDQHHIDDARQEAFGRLWGTLVGHPTVPSLGGTEGILDVDGTRGERASSWHADITFLDAYPSISILRPHVLPDRGGDTLWGNTAAAYAELPEPLRELADKLRAIHSNQYDYAGDRVKVREDGLKRFNEVFTSTVYETEHPLVSVHPVTGERTLLVGHFLQRLIGFGTSDSNRLIGIVTDHATRPENTVRWHWSPGDVAIWDNRATIHRAVDDYGSRPRVVRRTTVAGDVVVGVDGRPSVTRVLGRKPSIAA